jgi:hypothetical protein
VNIDQIAAFVQARVALPPPQPVFLGQAPNRTVLLRTDQGVLAISTAEELAEALVHDIEFRALQLGTWLGTVEGRLVAAAVGQAIPLAFRPQFDLVVEGLQRAAEMQKTEGQAKAGRVAATVLLVGSALSYTAYKARAA